MRFKSIDVLRGIAASWVVFYHLWNRFFPGGSSQDAAFRVPGGGVGHATFFAFGFGYLGVTLFFVLSGFCIHLPYALKCANSGSDQMSVAEFGRRRFWRLYPAYFASLIWTSLALLTFPLLAKIAHHAPIPWAELAQLKQFAASAFFLQQIYPDALKFNGVYWTLVFEVQFYLLYPALLWLCRRWSFNGMLAVLLGCELLLIVRPTSIPVFFLGRLYEWFLGMWLAESVTRKRIVPGAFIAFPVLLGIAVASVFWQPSWPYRDVFASTAFAALLSICLRQEAAWAWLNNRVLIAVGVFSYSLYLVHVPLIDLVWNGIKLIRLSRAGFPLWPAFLSVPLSFLMGYFFYRWTEKPFLRAPRIQWSRRTKAHGSDGLENRPVEDKKAA